VENPPFLWETIGFPHLCLFTPGCIILKNIGNDCSILQDVTSIRLGANISKLERWKMSKKTDTHNFRCSHQGGQNLTYSNQKRTEK
jgi:hypothetical protein